MKINWKALAISSILGLIFGIVFGYWMYHSTLRLESPSVFFGVMIGIILFCGTTGGIYIAMEQKTKKQVAVETISKRRVKWKLLLIYLLLLVSFGLIATFGEPIFPYWLYFAFVCIFAFLFLFLFAGAMIFVEKKK